MPAVTCKIDGTSVKGFYKVISNNGSPDAYVLLPKDQIAFVSETSTSGKIYHASDSAHASLIAETSALTIDHNGDALDTSEKVATYLSTWR